MDIKAIACAVALVLVGCGPQPPTIDVCVERRTVTTMEMAYTPMPLPGQPGIRNWRVMPVTRVHCDKWETRPNPRYKGEAGNAGR